LRNLLLVARLVTAAAINRKESRGGHYRSDYPQLSSAWERRQFATALSLGVLSPPPPAERASAAG
jgi:aspartate oxidase